jgi:pimeloyl-ACP methyl ester carboxylesterase
VLKLGCAARVRSAVAAVGGLASRVGLQPTPVVAEIWRSYTSLTDEDTRRAFLRTLRAVIDPRGQAVSAENRLHLATEMPTLIVWGDADRIIPVEHAHAAHTAIPGSQLEVFEGIGHYPHCEAPERFVAVLAKFIESTVPARITVSRHHVLGSSPS